MKVLKAILFYMISVNALGCAVPKPGAGINLEDLIDKSENIFIVEVLSTDGVARRKMYTLRVLEELKGKASGELKFLSRAKEHIQNDFESHNKPDFWEKDIGRSEWPCCICGPDHSFEKGFKYLYFPDYLGSKKSAEIINSNNDKWYQFVKKRLSR